MREHTDLEGARMNGENMLFPTPSKHAAHLSSQHDWYPADGQDLELEFGLGDDFAQDRSSLEIEVARRESSQQDIDAAGIRSPMAAGGETSWVEQEPGSAVKEGDMSLNLSQASIQRPEENDMGFDHFVDGEQGLGEPLQQEEPSFNEPLLPFVPFPEVEEPAVPVAPEDGVVPLKLSRSLNVKKALQISMRKRKLQKDSVTELTSECIRQNRNTEDILQEVGQIHDCSYSINIGRPRSLLN